jgi:L-fuconolactonase
MLESSLKAVCDLARFKNLYAKVDFIGTGTQMKYPCADLHAPALKVIEAYGPERCVWGSCYPNELWTPKITYSEHLRIFTEALPLSEQARRSVLGETARKIWFPALKA